MEYWNNWNAGTTGTLFFSPRLLKCCDASFSKAFPGDVLLSEALSVMALPLAGPSHLLEASTAGYFRLLASHSTLITRYLTLSPVISLYLTQAHRIALLGWQKDLTLQHEHDSWVGPPPDWPRQTSASPAESMSPRSLIY